MGKVENKVEPVKVTGPTTEKVEPKIEEGTKVGILPTDKPVDPSPEDKPPVKIDPKGIIDVAVTVIAVADPYHKEGTEFQLGKRTAEDLVKRGWVKFKEEEK